MTVLSVLETQEVTCPLMLELGKLLPVPASLPLIAALPACSSNVSLLIPFGCAEHPAGAQQLWAVNY